MESKSSVEAVYCPRCATHLPRSAFNPAAGRPNGLVAYCIACMRSYHTERQSRLDLFLSTMWHGSKQSAKKRKGMASEHTITKQDVKDIWTRQGGRCYYSHLPMAHAPRAPWSASLERLDPSLGYHPSNCVLCILELNGPQQWTVAKTIRFLDELETKYDERVVMQDLEDASTAPSRVTGVPPCQIIEREVIARDGVEHHFCTRCNKHKPRTEFGCNVRDQCKQCAKQQQSNWRATVRGAIKAKICGARGHSKAITKAITAGKRQGECGHTLTFEQGLNKLISQKGRCAYSGVLLRYGDNNEWLISLERLNSEKGYHIDNIVWVAWEWNGAERSAGTRKNEQAGLTEGWDKIKVDTLVASLRVKLGR